MVGEDDSLRESMIVHTICGLLMDPRNHVTVSILDQNYPDRKRLAGVIRKIHSPNLKVNLGIEEMLATVDKLRKIRPSFNSNDIYVWYGLEKMKNELFLYHQNDDEPDQEITPVKKEPVTKEEMLADFMNFLDDINEPKQEVREIPAQGSELTYDDCAAILKQAFEMGPENGCYHIAVFNNRKAMKNSKVIDLSFFENRIGTRMSTEDSYELFNSSIVINKTDENTVIYYPGSGQVVPLRPYLLPDNDWLQQFNEKIGELY